MEINNEMYELYKEADRKAQAFLAALKQSILDLPENPATTRIAPGVFTMSIKDLNQKTLNLSPEHYDFKYQYQTVIENIERWDMRESLVRLVEVIEQGWAFKYSGGTKHKVSLHPDVIANMTEHLTRIGIIPKVQTYETYCPLFPGFYGTTFQYDDEEHDIEHYNEENKTDLGYDDFEWDYADHNKRVCVSFVNKLETEINHLRLIEVKLEFEELKSPREYNFANDVINIKATLDLDQLIALVASRRADIAPYIKDKYTSCSGFISFHSNDIEDWLDKGYIMEKPGHRIGALLEAFCSTEFSDDDTMYWADDENWIDFTPKVQDEAE